MTNNIVLTASLIVLLLIAVLSSPKKSLAPAINLGILALVLAIISGRIGFAVILHLILTLVLLISIVVLVGIPANKLNLHLGFLAIMTAVSMVIGAGSLATFFGTLIFLGLFLILLRGGISD